MPVLPKIDHAREMQAKPCEPSSLGPNDAGQPPVVLVVDDDEPVRQALCELLESAGIAFAGFGCAREVLDSELLCAPGCLILDVRMPGLGGLALGEHLAAQGETKPIIFLTGGEVQLPLEVLRGGAVLLTKPAQGQAVLDAVIAAVAADALQRTARRPAFAADRAGAQG